MEKQLRVDDAGFCDAVFSWSIQDVCNEQLHVDKVKKIPNEFNSVEEYFGSYKYPLLEEIRTGLHSSLKALSTAPYAEVVAFEEAKPPGSLHYNIRVDYWRNRVGHANEPYRMLPGDVFILANHKPETASGLDLLWKSWAYAMVISMKDAGYEEDGSFSAVFRVRVSEDVQFREETWRSMFVVFLMNVTVEKRIWYVLHRFRNLEVVKRVLSSNALGTMKCSFCGCSDDAELTCQHPLLLSSHLNESQTEAVLACLRKIKCPHKQTVELIWGPPGTGKTKTVATLLATLHGMRCRILSCAPTNVAITALASCTVNIIRGSVKRNCGTVIHSVGDILLFGSRDRLKIGCEIEDIFFESRVKRLAECFGLTGWRYCFTAMIHLLENCVSMYGVYFKKNKDRELKDENHLPRVECKSFNDFTIKSFKSSAAQLEKCIYTMCTHIPKSFLGEYTFQNMVSLLELLQCFETLLLREGLASHSLRDLFSQTQPCNSWFSKNPMFSSLTAQRLKCISALKELLASLTKLDFPSPNSSYAMSDFCFQIASLIFCTAAGSFKLHSVKMEHMDVLVIDEAAQLKECEAMIPLQLPGLRNAILIGDECQLPATVFSNISSEAGFGKSLFERLNKLGCSNHLLNTQYRMHPSISCFPNANFYSSSICDAPIVKSKEYQKHYLRGEIFGSYSFINIFDGREERDDYKQSLRNLVEVATVESIINNLHKAWRFKGTLSIGVISPYAAQVMAIQERLGCKYENINGFEVKVSSIDGFQGSEKDIVILSTVRSNSGGSVGFMSSPRRTNVALTRARHCLWILGNGSTLFNSASVWAKIIRDAKSRNCFFNADENEDLAKAIVEVKKELNQYDDLLNANSVLFRSARWRVLFTYDFKKSFRNFSSDGMKNSVINLLLKLSGGWRPKKLNFNMKCQTSSPSLKQFKVENHFVLCTVEIIKESEYLQVLKFWNILPPEEIPKQVKRLEGIFSRYTEDYINHSKAQGLEGNLEIPRTWSASLNLVQFKSFKELGKELVGSTSDDQDNVKNKKVSESFLLMKYYTLSSDTLNTLLSGDCRELGFPFTLTEEEREILLFDKSTFVLGRSGTGKTTMLTLKMFRKEHQHHLVTQETYGTNGNVALAINEEDITDTNQPPVLRQLFVTASPKLCVAVKQHISQLESFACGSKFIAGRQSTDVDYADDTTIFKGIPDSFIDIPSTAYPVVITFRNFLLMLDGTVGNSFFERFPVLRQICNSPTGNSRSNAFQNFIKMNQVTYDLFCSDYWPHFNGQFTKKLDSLRVYIEIMSHIKGGLQAMNGKLSLEEYLQLSESRASVVGKKERQMIFEIFQDYEKMKVKTSHFDLADLVNDLHWRLQSEGYPGNKMDFVYIDEVQDLTMREISLFKYTCQNVDEGFVFSGDTAQTVARGVDFRFSDVRHLFYDEFYSSSRSDGMRKKGRVSKIFHLSHNFRTHAGIVKLAQSVIDIVFRYFPKTIDVLPPERSLIHGGEPPVLLESRQSQNALVTIFGNSGNAGGFGAEQVILVRDETVRQEISKYVKKQAIVMTIVECKGLAFQDVLLYNFFDSSPLKTQWGVVYEYMREQNLLEAASQLAFPSFNEAKHSLMCSELKQLYVAVTRARHRLWICENSEDFSKPMFDYWKEQGFVQVRVLNSSLAKEMQVASTPEEWKSRGFELLNENNFELATMCFTKSGDLYWQNFAKAAGLRAAADQMLISNPEMGGRVVREAAELFRAIGNADRAAKCYLDLEEYGKLRKNFKQLNL